MFSDGAQLTHTAVLTPGEDGWVCAQIAEVPEAISQGRTVEEAKANVADALELALAGADRRAKCSTSGRDELNGIDGLANMRSHPVPGARCCVE